MPDADREILHELGARIVDFERHFDEHRGFVRADDSTLPHGLPDLSEALDE
jgi:aldehyde:ferredoxin oxidoreductase